MTVGELIDLLRQQPEDAYVQAYTSGSLSNDVTVEMYDTACPAPECGHTHRVVWLDAQ